METRLRPNAHRLAEGATTRPTADGRLAMRFDDVPCGPVPLALCVVPRPSRSATELVVDRLAPARALLLLSRFPRVLGWREPVSLAATFHGLADLVERVPVVMATIPWDAPFDGVLPVLRDAMPAAVQR